MEYVVSKTLVKKSSQEYISREDFSPQYNSTFTAFIVTLRILANNSLTFNQE